MRVKCPQCGEEQEYIPSDSQKRKRKYCVNPSCLTSTGKRVRFDITPSRILPGVVYRGDQEQEPGKQPSTAEFSGVVYREDQSRTKVNFEDQSRFTARGTDVEGPKVGNTILLNLDPINIRILDGLKVGQSMADISRQEHVSKMAISKRVKKLVKAGLLVEKKTWPKTFEVLPELHECSAKDLIGGIRIHQFQIIMRVLATEKRFNQMKRGFKQVRLEHWTKYIFYHQYVTLQFNESKRPNIQAHITAAGRTVKDAYDNAEKKAFKLRDDLEAKFPLVLANPIYKPVNELNFMRDYVTGFWNPEQMDILQSVYYDKSDPDAIFETKNVDTVRKFLEVMNTHDNIKKDLEDHKAQVEKKLEGIKDKDPDLRQQIKEMREDLSQLTQAVSSLVKTMTALQSSPGKEPKTEGGLYL